MRGIPRFVRGIGDHRIGLVNFNRHICGGFSPHTRMVGRAYSRMLTTLNVGSPGLRLTVTLRGVTLRSPFFVRHGLCPGISFCSNVVLGTVNVPASVFAIVFSLTHASN